MKTLTVMILGLAALRITPAAEAGGCRPYCCRLDPEGCEQRLVAGGLAPPERPTVRYQCSAYSYLKTDRRFLGGFSRFQPAAERSALEACGVEYGGSCRMGSCRVEET